MRVEFAQVQDELAGDRVGGIGAVDEAGEMVGHGGRIFRGHARQRFGLFRRGEAGGDEIVGARQRLAGLAVRAHAAPAATPPASTKPVRSVRRGRQHDQPVEASATPLASGICASAAMKSSSTGNVSP